jgi:translin
MINKNLFNKILKEHKRYDLLREEVIKNSREVLKKSKQAIFLLHRDDIGNAEKNLLEAEDLLKKLTGLFNEENKLRYEGSYKACAEEFVEAKMFLEFIKNKNVDFKSRAKFTFDDCLGGISDLTGKVLRKAVQVATQGKFEELPAYKKAMEQILGELVKFDFTGKLRMKYDAAKRNLRRMEEIMYDIKIK